ncbi:MAG TPA: hypothetical protein VMH90_03635, partial [Thermoplasmata archaeon]|nr:hypothetical protein [Thermoplasmata archaeon]
PLVTAVVFTPPEVEEGIRTHINGTVTGGTGSYTYVWSHLPTPCHTSNSPSFFCTPNETGDFPVELAIRDTAGGTSNATSLLHVNPALSAVVVTATPSELDFGMTVSFWANYTGGTAPYTYTWSGLPAGCGSLNATPLRCHPATLGQSTINVNVTDVFGEKVNGTVKLLVNQPLSLVSGAVSPVSTDVGVKVTFYLNATQGSAPYNYTFTGLPAGCTPPNAKAAACVPTQAGTFSVVGTVTDAAGASVSRTFSLTVVPPPSVTSFVASPAILDVGGTLTLSAQAANGSGAYSFAYSGVPTGCQGNTGQSFSCHPTASGTFSVIVTATDEWGKAGTANTSVLIGPTFSLGTFTVDPSPVTQGNAVSFSVTTKGGLAPYAYLYHGLPSGCASDNSSELSCTPASSGTFTVQILVTDHASVTVIGSVSLSVTAPSSGASGSFLTSPAGIGLIVVVVAVVAVVAVLALRRRGRPPEPAPPEAYEAPPEEGA